MSATCVYVILLLSEIDGYLFLLLCMYVFLTCVSFYELVII